MRGGMALSSCTPCNHKASPVANWLDSAERPAIVISHQISLCLKPFSALFILHSKTSAGRKSLGAGHACTSIRHECALCMLRDPQEIWAEGFHLACRLRTGLLASLEQHMATGHPVAVTGLPVVTGLPASKRSIHRAEYPGAMVPVLTIQQVTVLEAQKRSLP